MDHNFDDLEMGSKKMRSVFDTIFYDQEKGSTGPSLNVWAAVWVRVGCNDANSDGIYISWAQDRPCSRVLRTPAHSGGHRRAAACSLFLKGRGLKYDVNLGPTPQEIFEGA